MTGVLAASAARSASAAESASVPPPPQAVRTAIKESERPRRSARVGDEKGFISTPDSIRKVDGTWQSEADGGKQSRALVEHPACELVISAKAQNVGKQVTSLFGITPEMGGKANPRQLGTAGVHAGIAYIQHLCGRHRQTLHEKQQRVCRRLRERRITETYDGIKRVGDGCRCQQNLGRGRIPIGTDAQLQSP